jgi:radical SAM superfamily enzyme YgiQ (UPF0313 family)
MKALLINPSTPTTFWSFLPVLQLLGKKATLPPLGLLTVAALLPQDWELQVIDREFQQVTETQWNDADVVLITGMTIQCEDLIKAIHEGRERQKTIVVGGAWAFHYPEDALKEGADIVLVGEAEETMPQVLEAIAKQQSGVIIRAEKMADLERSPLPRYDLVDLDAYLNVSIQFSRGCPFQCEFCDVTNMFGHKVRTKNPKQIVAELQRLYDLGYRHLMFFADDNFVGSFTRTKALLHEMIPWLEAHGNPFGFYTQASVNLASDDEVLDLMVRASFFKVFLGIETLDQESLVRAKKSQNTRVDLVEVCRKINEAGLGIIAGCILGFDGEQPGAGDRLLELARLAHIPEMFVSLLQALPATDLWNRLDKEDRLLTKDYRNLGNQTSPMNFTPTRPVEEIVQEFTTLYRTLYDRKNYLNRVTAHILRMKPLATRKPFKLPSAVERRALFAVLLNHGILYPTRFVFWRNFFKILANNPSQLVRYFDYSIGCEHYNSYVRVIEDAFGKRPIM